MGIKSSSEGKCLHCNLNSISAILFECAYENVLDPTIKTISKEEMIEKNMAVYACANGHYYLAKKQFKTI